MVNSYQTCQQCYQLLKRDTRWHWDKSRAEAFEAAKNALQDDTLLAHYDSNCQLLACDASPYGLGAVLILSHIMDDGQERPIAYAFRTLTAAENYSQALGVVFTIQKFHNYFYGREFIIESDHRPLAILYIQ